jgi:hypothetical protein
MLESIIRIVFCALTGFFAFGRRMGFIGTFLLAPAATPVVVLPVLLPTGPSHRVEWRHGTQQRNCYIGAGTCIPC